MKARAGKRRNVEQPAPVCDDEEGHSDQDDMDPEDEFVAKIFVFGSKEPEEEDVQDGQVGGLANIVIQRR